MAINSFLDFQNYLWQMTEGYMSLKESMPKKNAIPKEDAKDTKLKEDAKTNAQNQNKNPQKLKEKIEKRSDIQLL